MANVGETDQPYGGVYCTRCWRWRSECGCDLRFTGALLSDLLRKVVQIAVRVDHSSAEEHLLSVVLKVAERQRDFEARGQGVYVTGTGQLLFNVHKPKECRDRHCPLHNPSDHPLKNAPTHWRPSGSLDVKPSHLERICRHGIGHPDPDQLNLDYVAVHDCDGCCGGRHNEVQRG